ncbi:MAG: hypothetical protein HC896_01595 [Bacteroidales bacterium]|nr:hypothetical protein [Bacteroidales bacterium]
MKSGTLTDNNNSIEVGGYCTFDGTHIYGGTGTGIELNGSNEQFLMGNGTIGRLSINNANNVVVPLGNELSITNELELQSGIFYIGRNLLRIGENASITTPTAFSASNMIETNISFTDNGVEKTIPSGASSFIFPMGSLGRYTPVSLNISANMDNSATITVKPANELQPSIIEDSEAPDPEITDSLNVLQYHWLLKTLGLAGFSADVNMQFDPTDVRVTAPYDSSFYIPARLLADGSGLWNKFTTDDFDGANHLINFSFVTASDDEVSGDYTAGVDGASFLGAIPDTVPIYATNSTGNWNTGTIWTPNVSGGPRGAMTIIGSAHTVTLANNYVSSYTTTINGALRANSTYGHRLGRVDGTGTLYLETGAVPAGIYDDFFSTNGGTIEFGGPATYDILSTYYQVNNLRVSGSGQKRLPNNNVTLLGDLQIAGPGLVNENDVEIGLHGNLTLSSGSFDGGSGSSATLKLKAIKHSLLPEALPGLIHLIT